jgi:DNA-binding ferritin-like protein
MSLQNLKLVLEETFAANFVSYYRAHVAHVNIVGENFYSNHKLLQKIYEYFQDNIDTIAEKLRTVRATMPNSLSTVYEISPIADSATEGDCDELLRTVLASLEAMIEQYHELNDAAEAVNYIDISNFAQDQIAQIAKFRWMLEATLEDEDKEDDDD